MDRKHNATRRQPTITEMEAEVRAAEAGLKEASIAKMVAERDAQFMARRLDDAWERLFKARHWLYMLEEQVA